MENLKKSNSFKYVQTMLDVPTCPKMAVLRELLAFYKNGTSRRYLEQATDILNVPDVIMHLRRSGIAIDMTFKKTTNKYGRPVKYGIYKLLDFQQAINFYKKHN